MKHQSAETISNVRVQAGQLLQSIIEQATERAMGEAHKPSSRASRLSKPFSRHKSTSGQEIALNAARTAVELWQAALDRAGGSLEHVQATVGESAGSLKETVGSKAQHVQASVTDSAQNLRDSVGERAQTVQHTVSDSAQALKGSVGERAQNVQTSVSDTAHAVSGTVSDVARKAEDTTKAVAHNTATGSRNTVGLVFWTGAAGAVVYWAFLDEHRREQVKHYAMTAINEVREILAEYQGKDGEFSSGN